MRKYKHLAIITCIGIATCLAIWLLTHLLMPNNEGFQGTVVSLAGAVVFFVLAVIYDNKNSEEIPQDNNAIKKNWGAGKVHGNSFVFVYLALLNVALWLFFTGLFSIFSSQFEFLVINKHVSVSEYGNQALQVTVGGALFLGTWLPMLGIAGLHLGRNVKRVYFPLVFLSVVASIGLYLVVRMVTNSGAAIKETWKILAIALGGQATPVDLITQDKLVAILIWVGFLFVFIGFYSAYIWICMLLGKRRIVQNE